MAAPRLLLAAPLLVLLAVLLLLTSAAPADARVTVRVTSPKPDAVQVGRAVTVRVRVRGEVRRFRVLAHSPRGSRSLGGRFERGRRGVWRARLRVGRDLRPGQNHLYVHVRRPNGRESVATAHFVMATRRADLVARVPAPGSGPFRYSFRLRRGADDFRVRLNGRAARRIFESDDGRVWHGDIRPRHRMRFGPNRLRIVAFDESGRYEVVRQRKVLRRARPLADAGTDRIVHPRGGVRLDGTASRKRRAGGLRYRWRIVSRPKGSRARLVGAGRVRPRLVRAAPGHYRVRLQVREAPRRGRRAGAAATASDSVTLSVQQPQGPAGVPVQTIVNLQNPGIQVGSTFYPGAAGFGQILVLDRATLTPTRAIAGASQIFSLGGDLAGLIQGITDEISDKQVMLIAGPGGPLFGGLDGADVANMQSALAALGGTGDQQSVYDLIAGTYTLIGIPGLPRGTAIESSAARQGNLPPGGVAGSFVTDIHSNYSFKWPASFITFDTQAPGSTDTQNRVTVGSQSYASDNVTDQYGGWHLVWLDADNLGLRGNFTFQNCFGAAPCLDGLLAQLQTILNDGTPGLIFLSSINNTQHTQRASIETGGGILQALSQFGANEPAFLAGGEYTLVGLAGLGAEGPNAGLDLAQAVANSPSSRIAGVLRRNDQGLWQGGTNGAPAPTQDVTLWQPQLQQILAQPDQPFAALDSPGEQAAAAYIAAGVNLPSVSNAAQMRSLYWNDDSVVWSDKLTLLAELEPCGQSPCSGSFAAVKQTFTDEWDDVSTVRDYFTGGGSDDLDGIYQEAFGDSTLGFVAIAGAVMAAYPSPPAQSPGSPQWLNVLDSSLTLAQGLTGFVPVAGEELTNALAVAQGAEEIYGAVANTSSGAPALDPRVFEGDIYKFGTDLENAWQNQVSSLSHVADLLVSDAGRLSAVADQIGTPGQPGGWGLNSSASDNITDSLQASIAGYIWSSMLPVSTQVFTCDPEQRVDGTPALDQAILGYYTSENAGEGGGAPFQVSSSWAYIASQGDPTNFPTGTILSTLFGTDSGRNQLSLQHEYFMQWGARDGSGDPNDATLPAGQPGFEWVSEMRDGGACQAGQ